MRTPPARSRNPGGQRSPTPPTPPARRAVGPALPRGAGRAGWTVFHPGRVEGGPPAPIIVLRELEIVALAVHADRHMTDALPRVQPRYEAPIGCGRTRAGSTRRSRVQLRGVDRARRAWRRGYAGLGLIRQCCRCATRQVSAFLCYPPAHARAGCRHGAGRVQGNRAHALSRLRVSLNRVWVQHERGRTAARNRLSRVHEMLDDGLLPLDCPTIIHESPGSGESGLPAHGFSRRSNW